MKRSLGTTLFLYVLSGELVGLGGMSFFFYQILEKQAKNDIQAQLNTEVRLIERQLAEVERTGINLAIAVKNLKEQGINNPKAYEDLLLETYLQRPELTMAIGFGQTSYGFWTIGNGTGHIFIKMQKSQDKSVKTSLSLIKTVVSLNYLQMTTTQNRLITS